MTEKHDRACTLSKCRQYMYRLWWNWHGEEKRCVFIMLNPATTDKKELKKNTTVRNCKAIANNENCGSMILLDLFPYVARNWGVLMEERKQGKDIIRNERHKKYVESTLKRQNILIVIAWKENRSGNPDDMEYFNDQIKHMEAMIKKHAPNAKVLQLRKRSREKEEGVIIHPCELRISEEIEYSEEEKPYRLNPYKYKYQ